jgi:sodium-dependent dicarboxylate transporter 2/3/5
MVLALDAKKRIAVLIAGFIILVIFYFLPTPGTFEYNGEEVALGDDGKMMLGILVLGVVLWISEAIPLAITGLLVMILQPILYLAHPREVFSAFGNTAVFFLMGAFIIAGAIEKQGLHKRMALSLLQKFKGSPKVFTFGILLSSALLSFIMPNLAVAALMLPIVLSILITMNIMPRVSNFGKVSMLSIAFGCSIGSIGTLIGGARNPLTIGILEAEYPNISISFLEWMIYCIPIVFIALPCVWLFLITFFPLEVKDLKGVDKKLSQEIHELGSMRTEEKTVIFILIGTIVAWIVIPTFFSNIGLAVVAIFSAVILFFSGTITWQDIERRVPWGIILLYGGAITLGVGMVETGAAKWLAIELIRLSGENLVVIILMIIGITVLFTNIMSNTAAIAMILPIGLGFVQVLGFDSPVFLSLLIASAGGFAFMLVIATPANVITYSAGYFSTKDLIRVGVILNFICILILFVISVTYWYILGLW